MQCTSFAKHCLVKIWKISNIQNGVDVWRDHDKGHGRIEDRSVISLDLTVYPLEELKKFSGIKCVVRVNSVVWRNSEQTQEITDLPNFY